MVNDMAKRTTHQPGAGDILRLCADALDEVRGVPPPSGRLRSARDELAGKSTPEKLRIIAEHEDQVRRRARELDLAPISSLAERCKELHRRLTKRPGELDAALEAVLDAVAKLTL
jgi:hypothetical protein